VLQDLLSGLVAALPVGYAFGAGMVAAVNPCGFAMLPAYLSLYLGAREEDFARRSPLARTLRALLVGGSVSLGFVLLFGIAGAGISAGGNALLKAMPWVGLLIGGLLVLLGMWVLAGRTLYSGIFERLANRVGDPGDVSVRGFFLFGLAYGAASLSCTLPVFLAVVGSGISAGGFLAGMGRFLGYGLGMASVLVALTLALAFFKGSMVKRLRGAMPYAQLASAILLVLAGVYTIFYGWLYLP
jgi:cytochrome c biogenesis protein CcdA